MSREYVVLITLIAYKLVLIGVGFWASKRTHSTEDFFIGGKTLGPWVAAISSSASASSAWSLLGVSGAAYMMGYSALWLFPSVMSGYLFNWLWLAPRLRRLANKQGAVTLTNVVAGQGSYSRLITYLCSFIIVFSFAFYIAAQFQAAGSTFSATFDMSSSSAIILGTGIILLYTLLGGFWAVSVTDTIQGLLMAAAALVLPIAALVNIGGFDALFSGLAQQYNDQQLSATGAFAGWSAVAFIFGMMGIGLGYTGQPHVLNRFMAIKDEQSIKVGKYIGIGWPTIVFGGMLILGMCARVLIPFAENNEQVLFGVTELLFHPIVAGIIIAAVLSAIMSTADSQLLVAASSLAYDLKLTQESKKQLLLSRITLAVLSLVALLIALYAPEAIFSRVLFAWAALGSAFGPVVIVLLLGYKIKGSYRLAAIFTGFSLTVYFNWQANTPGDILERVVPFVVAAVIAYLGTRGIQNKKEEGELS